MFTKKEKFSFTNKKDEQDQEETQNTVFTLQTNNLAPPETGSYFCSADQCSLNNPHAPAQGFTRPDSFLGKTTPQSPMVYEQVFKVSEETMKPETHFINTSLEYSEEEMNSNDWSQFIPDELYQMMKEAAKQGFLLSFLLTLSDETVSDYLKGHHYSPGQIYWITQAIRAFTLIAIGTSPGIALGLPLSNYLLTEYLGFNKTHVNYFTTGSIIAWGLLGSPFSVLNTSLTMASSISSSIIGGQIARSSYQFIRNRFFSSGPVSEVEVEVEQEKILQKKQ